MRCWITMLVVLLVSTVVQAEPLEWHGYGPPGASVVALLRNQSNDQYIAVARDRVFSSLSPQDGWESLPDLPDNTDLVSAVWLDEENAILLVIPLDGLPLSLEVGAQQWETFATGLPQQGVRCYALSRHPSSGELWLACTAGLFHCTPGSQTWQPVELAWGDSYYPEEIQAAADGSVYVRIFNNNNIQRLEPNHIDWTFLVGTNGFPSPAQSPQVVYPNPANANQLMVVSKNPVAVYYSDDRGQNWRVPANGSVPTAPLKPVWLDNQPGVVSLDQYSRLDPSTNTWSVQFDFPLPGRYDLLNGDSGQTLAASTGQGVWLREGQVWQHVSKGFPSYGTVRTLAQSASQSTALYAGLSQTGVWYTADDGGTWESRSNGIQPDPAYGISLRSFAVHPAQANLLLAGTEVAAGSPAGVYRSTDGGQSWNRLVQTTDKLVFTFFFVPSNPTIVLAGTAGDAIWRSSDSGQTWVRVADPLTFRNVTSFTQSSNGRIWAGLVGGFEPTNGYAYSDDLGLTWTEVGDYASASLTFLSGDPGTILRGTGFWDSGSGILRSVDNGASWPPSNTGLPERLYSPGVYNVIRALESDAMRGGNAYALVETRGIYGSTDRGQTWNNLGGDSNAYCLLYSNRQQGTLFAGSSQQGVQFAQLPEPLATLTATPTPSWQGLPTATATPTSGFDLWPETTPDGQINSQDLLMLLNRLHEQPPGSLFNFSRFWKLED